jgi:hypothetical protein
MPLHAVWLAGYFGFRRGTRYRQHSLQEVFDPFSAIEARTENRICDFGAVWRFLRPLPALF